MKYCLNTLADNFEVVVENGGGYIVGTLKENKRPTRYNAALDALESVILALACEGVNVCVRPYVSAFQTALDAIDRNFG